MWPEYVILVFQVVFPVADFSDLELPVYFSNSYFIWPHVVTQVGNFHSYRYDIGTGDYSIHGDSAQRQVESCDA